MLDYWPLDASHLGVISGSQNDFHSEGNVEDSTLAVLLYFSIAQWELCHFFATSHDRKFAKTGPVQNEPEEE